jgi:hypothetical protein
VELFIVAKICRWLAAGRWFSPDTSVSSINKTECHDITEILLKVALNTITLSLLKKKHIWYLGSHIRLFALVSDNCWLFKYFLKEFLKKMCYQANTFIGVTKNILLFFLIVFLLNGRTEKLKWKMNWPQYKLAVITLMTICR